MKGKLTFLDLVSRIAGETGQPAQRVHDCLTEAVRLNEEELSNAGRSAFPGLGHFSLKWHEARTGHNPRTGEAMAIPAHNLIHFSPEAPLRTFINRRYSRLKAKPIKEKGASDRASGLRRVHWAWLVGLLLLVLLLLVFRPRTWMGRPAPPVAPSQTEEAAEPVALTAEESPTTVEPVATTEAPVEEAEPVAPAPAAGIASAQHTVGSGDNLWSLALAHFGGSAYWPLIYQANAPLLDDPDLLPVGVSLQLPALEGRPLALTESDVDRLAQAHVAVYRAYRRLENSAAVGHLWVAWHLRSGWVEGQGLDAADLARARRMPGKPELD